MYRAGKAHNSERAHTMRRALYFAAVSRLPGDCRDAQGFMTEGRSWSQEVAGGRVFKTAFARWGGSDEANFSFHCSAIIPFVVLALSVPSLLSASTNCCVSGLSDTSKYCEASRVLREARGKDDSLLPYRCSAFRPFIFPREGGRLVRLLYERSSVSKSCDDMPCKRRSSLHRHGRVTCSQNRFLHTSS